jgi:hypothetical protein
MANELTFKERYDIAHGIIKKGKVTPKNADLILVDRSGSMCSNAIGGLTRIECVRKALAPFKGRAHVLAFDNRVEEVDCDAIPDPRGSTYVARALSHALSLEPLHVLVMCDGCPTDSYEKIFDVASQVAQQCIIDTLYIGPPNSIDAIAFMKKLAEVGHGRYSAFDLSEQSPLLLSAGVANLLALPDPNSVVKL